MREYVLTDSNLAGIAEQLLLLALDTERVTSRQPIAWLRTS